MVLFRVAISFLVNLVVPNTLFSPVVSLSRFKVLNIHYICNDCLCRGLLVEKLLEPVLAISNH